MDALFSGLLIQAALVYRRPQVEGEDARDSFNQPITASPELGEPVAVYPCRCTAPSGGRQNSDRMTDVVETTHVLFLERDADLREDDIVTVLQSDYLTADVDEDQHVVTEAVVQLVKHRVDGIGIHHIEAELASQRDTT